MTKHLNEIRLEIVRLIQDITFLIAFLHSQLNNLVKFHAFCLQLFHIQLWCNDDLVFGKHLQHVVGDAKQGGQRKLEGMETTFQTLHHVNTIDASQRLTNMNRIAILSPELWLQKFNCTIARIMQMRVKLVVRQNIQRVEEAPAGVSIHLIFQ